jgi:hypothetical protein
MTESNLAIRETPSAILEKVVALGDLSKLTPSERLTYYARTCESVGLNPLTRPFEFISLQGKLTLYARKDCTDQLRRVHKVSLVIKERILADGVFTVHVGATAGDGRVDEDIGVVPIGADLKGEARANAMMKALTKAKRRATLSICGLGWLDESEIESIPDAVPLDHDPHTGEVHEPPLVPPAPPEGYYGRPSLAIRDAGNLRGAIYHCPSLNALEKLEKDNARSLTPELRSMITSRHEALQRDQMPEGE